MELLSVFMGLLVAPAVAALCHPPTPGDHFGVDVKKLAEAWTRERISPRDPSSLKHRELLSRVHSLVREHPEVLRAEAAGASAEGREILLVSAGGGTESILLWSQMHGDEPTATSALMDLLNFFGRHRRESWVAEILTKYTILCIPMLNPDGAERNQRRNAQNLDINRDARALQSPEGRLLKQIRDNHRPFLGFNLHNQNSLTTVGNTGRVATIALLAVAADVPQPAAGPESSDDRRLLAKQVTAVLYEALSPFVYGHISRYDETINPRAFGDNMTLWGTPTVLIESGGYGPDREPDFTVMLNFVGIMAALDSLASGKVQQANPAVFDALKMNSETPIFDLILRNASVYTGAGLPPFLGDVAIRRDLRAGGESEALIAEIGDLGVFTAHRTLDCGGALLTPGLIAWDPERRLGSGKANDLDYLRAGVTTLLETTSLDQDAGGPPPADRPAEPRHVNWGFVVSGVPGQTCGWELRASRWLAAGARALVNPADGGAALHAQDAELAGWFGVESMSRESADRYRFPPNLGGSPEAVLPRWTSEAALQFRIPRRGSISLGGAADLVLWKGAGAPGGMRGLRPQMVILNGRVVNLEKPEPHGRFIR